MLALALWPAAAAAAPADAGERVTIVTLPRGTTLSTIAEASPRFAVGFMSAGLGSVPSDQTYLDIGQGNRVFGSLYPEPLRPLFVRGDRVPRPQWRATVERAEGAPAQIVPGLLVAELEAAGVPTRAIGAEVASALIAVDREGRVGRRDGCELGSCPGLSVGAVEPERLRRLAASLGAAETLIAIERPPPLGRQLAIGIAGSGFAGALRSETTRLGGYVTSTDLAPTILDRFGVGAPDEMTGRVIGSADGVSVAELASLQRRLAEVTPRRHPVIGINLAIWCVVAIIASLLWRRRLARLAVATLAVTIAWLPTLLLITGALMPSETAERLLIGVGAPALALGSVLGARGRFGERAGFAAFALAAAVSVVSTAVDVLAGSGWTALSLLGPNPDLGVRFFGIGNELEAVIGALLALGCGAAVAALRPEDPRRVVSIAAAITALLAVLVFAPGRFGADVGAAITFPAGAAGVVLAARGLGRRRLVAVAAAPAVALAALVALDLAIGGDAHLSRSVLDAGGFDRLGEVVERRIRLGAGSFSRFIDSFWFLLALAAIAAGILARRRILGWFEGRPAARAGLAGGVAAAAVGTLANDSGALLLMVGTAYLVGYVGLGWASRDR